MTSIPFFRPSASRAKGPVGIIDIGSNSVRLVIYEGANRIPSILFNEKIMAGLGKGLGKSGALDPQAVERALVALARAREIEMPVAEAVAAIVSGEARVDAVVAALLARPLRGEAE